MRILVVIPHYCSGSQSSLAGYGSYGPRLPRLAALSEMLQSLFSHFGSRRIASRTVRASTTPPDANVLDVVIVTVRGFNVLDDINLDPDIAIEYFDGDPMMLMFEAQRLLRERAGRYDIYGMMEDDIVIHDPLFFEKLQWFQSTFPAGYLLQPHRYEISKSGRVEKLLIDPKPRERSGPFVREGQVDRLAASWQGREARFELPLNPHAACYFVSDEQLRMWVDTEWFYDRDTSCVGPLESAVNLALGRTFDIYKPLEEQSNFLEVEHFGTRFANLKTEAGTRYMNSVLYDLAEKALAGQADGSGMVSDHRADNEKLKQQVRRMEAMLRSRGKLFAALTKAILGKL